MVLGNNAARNLWANATCLSLHRGDLNDDEPYLRSVVLQQWLFGYELPDTILMITEDGNLYVCATKKKCDFLKPAVGKDKNFTLHLLLRSKDDDNAENYDLLLEHASKAKLGVLVKERATNKENRGGILGPWENKLDEAKVEMVDVTHSLALVMAPKDDIEWDLMKKSSVLSNKVMKHGCIKRLEEIIEEEAKITHEQFATEIEAASPFGA